MLLIEKLQKRNFALQHDHYAVFLPRRVTQLTKIGLNAQQQSLHDCKIPQKSRESWQIHCVFRLSLGLSTQILEVEYKQAYKMIETGVLVWKSKDIKPYQPILFYFGSNMHKAKWWTLVSYGIFYFECQIMSRMHAGRWVKIEQPYLNSMTRTPKSKLFILHYRSIPCLNTLVGIGRYLITLLKYRLFHYIVELYPTFLHYWAIPNPNTLSRYTLSFYMAK